MHSFIRRPFSLLLAFVFIVTVFAFIAVHYGTNNAALAFLGANAVAYALTATPCLGANLTMLDIAKLSNNDPTVGLIEENLKYTPELNIFPFRTIKGTSYKTGIRTGLPTTGFRAANEGQTPGKSTFKQLLIEAFLFGGQIEVDKAVADANEDGPAALQAIEANGIMQSAMRNLASQIYYGVTQDAKGFPGLKASLVKGAVTSAGDAVVIDAAGNNANLASSVYAVRFGNRECTLIGGNNKAWQLDDFTVQQIVAANGGKMTAYVAGLNAWIGLQIAHENVARRICNVCSATGTLTDGMLANLLNSFPVGYTPDVILMSRRSRTQLQTSRTVVLQGQGKNRPDQPVIAPIPTEYDGVPIVASDAILNTDAVE